jgi:hypothetical protein
VSPCGAQHQRGCDGSDSSEDLALPLLAGGRACGACLLWSWELVPPHLCFVGGQARGKSCLSSCGVMVGRKLSGPITILRQVVTAEAL